MAISFESVLTCPHCGYEEVHKIPLNKQLRKYTCIACQQVIVAPADQCCIICAYGSNQCLMQQGWYELMQKMQKEQPK